jgi:hypothetical protein
MPPTPQTMEERFDKKFMKFEGYFDIRNGYMFKADPKTVKEFITQEIQLALDKRDEELREKIENLMQHEMDWLPIPTGTKQGLYSFHVKRC